MLASTRYRYRPRAPGTPSRLCYLQRDGASVAWLRSQAEGPSALGIGGAWT